MKIKTLISHLIFFCIKIQANDLPILWYKIDWKNTYQQKRIHILTNAKRKLRKNRAHSRIINFFKVALQRHELLIFTNNVDPIIQKRIGLEQNMIFESIEKAVEFFSHNSLLRPYYEKYSNAFKIQKGSISAIVLKNSDPAKKVSKPFKKLLAAYISFKLGGKVEVFKENSEHQVCTIL